MKRATFDHNLVLNSFTVTINLDANLFGQLAYEQNTKIMEFENCSLESHKSFMSTLTRFDDYHF